MRTRLHQTFLTIFPDAITMFPSHSMFLSIMISCLIPSSIVNNFEIFIPHKSSSLYPNNRHAVWLATRIFDVRASIVNMASLYIGKTIFLYRQMEPMIVSFLHKQPGFYLNTPLLQTSKKNLSKRPIYTEKMQSTALLHFSTWLEKKNVIYWQLLMLPVFLPDATVQSAL